MHFRHLWHAKITLFLLLLFLVILFFICIHFCAFLFCVHELTLLASLLIFSFVSVVHTLDLQLLNIALFFVQLLLPLLCCHCVHFSAHQCVHEDRQKQKQLNQKNSLKTV